MLYKENLYWYKKIEFYQIKSLIIIWNIDLMKKVKGYCFRQSIILWQFMHARFLPQASKGCFTRFGMIHSFKAFYSVYISNLQYIIMSIGNYFSKGITRYSLHLIHLASLMSMNWLVIWCDITTPYSSISIDIVLLKEICSKH